ncbi:hypothetical protein H8959_011903 [Pygathrix nigripes]
MESIYLRKHLGACLTQGLAEVARVHPADPIEYLALWIYKFKENVTMEQLRQKEMAELEHERELALMEQEMMERLKAEELLLQQIWLPNIFIFMDVCVFLAGEAAAMSFPDYILWLREATLDSGKTLAEISDRYGAPNLSRVEELDEPMFSDVALNIDQDL